MIWLKILIAVIGWLITDFIGERIEFDKETSDYGKFNAYASLWVCTFFVLFLILSSF